MASARLPCWARAWSRAPYVVAVAIGDLRLRVVSAGDRRSGESVFRPISVARQKLGGARVAGVARALPVGYRPLTKIARRSSYQVVCEDRTHGYDGWAPGRQAAGRAAAGQWA